MWAIGIERGNSDAEGFFAGPSGHPSAGVHDEEKKKAGDDPADAFRDDDQDGETDTEGQEALSRPQDLEAGQRRVVDDD